MLDLNGLLGRVLNTGGKLLDTPGKKVLAGGAAAGLLLTETGRDIAGSALKYGGIAALGGLAYHAWQKYNEQQKAEAGQPAAPVPPAELPPPSAVEAQYVPQDPAQRENLAKLIISAMVNAAKADGTLDEEEQAAILGHADTLQLSEEEQSFLFAEFGKPFDLEPIVKAANTPEVAAEVYAASVIAVGRPSPIETAYLKRLAQRLGLPDPVVQEINETIGVARAAA